MALESLTGTVYIDDLNSANPVGATDPKSEGDDHIRGIKNVLKTTFPNIDGAVTPTPAELNLLGSQEGGFLLKGVSTGGGTADAITADFTPNITLTDGVTVIVRAQGSNTVSNPTFTPDGLTTKTIVKNSNEALVVGDISGASHELILKYNSSNDNWSLLNPKSKPAVSGALVYASAGTQSIPDSTETALTFDQETYDTSSIHDNSTNNTRLTVPSGVTKIKLIGSALFASDTVGFRFISFYKNGYPTNIKTSAHPPGTTLSIGVSSPILDVVATDYFELFVYQTSTGALNVTKGPFNTWFSMEIIE